MPRSRPAVRTFGIALLGGGTVGGGVLRLLATQADRLADRFGVRFDVRHVIVRDAARRRDYPGSPAVSIDADAAIDDPAVDLVVEVVGGVDRAGGYVERALRAGKPVVTANKALLAARGPALFALARERRTCIAFEASCGGGIPIIDALVRGLAGNDVRAIVGIVNGTCNYILTRMTQAALPYADALAEAQAAGFAEADPTSDVCGTDAAQKLALLAGLAFGGGFAPADMLVEGIDGLDARDIDLARELGYVVKLLAIGQRTTGDAVSLRVCPTLVHHTDILADVAGSFNAIGVWGDALGHALFYGRGAGASPTASAIVTDLVGVATGATQVIFDQSHVYPDSNRAVPLLPVESIESRYYLRMTAKDLPGVMASLTTILGRHAISLGAVLQHESDGDFVPIVITTHLANEGAIRRAIAEINALDVIGKPTVCLRILDQPKEFAE